MKANEYKCAMCGNVYKKGWTYEEAKEEAKEIFSKHPDDWKIEQEVIYDDCFNKINPAENKEEVEKAKKLI